MKVKSSLIAESLTMETKNGNVDLIISRIVRGLYAGVVVGILVIWQKKHWNVPINTDNIEKNFSKAVCVVLS
ncbi:MAG: hypothetical protein K2L03_07420 [Bacteroidales bacterium]|nr:hypothetical protein [Bacteroidales bacterium]